MSREPLSRERIAELWTGRGNVMRPTEFRTLLAAAERVAALEGLLREVCVTLGRCRDLFSDIRGDWTDPRTECREGWRVIDEAIAAIEAALRAENGGGDAVSSDD